MPPQGLITQLNSAVIKGVCLFLTLHVFSFFTGRKTSRKTVKIIFALF